MTYISTSVNPSAIISEKAGAAMTEPAFFIAKFDTNGGVVKAGAGECALGVFMPTNDEAVHQGDGVDIQVKDIGYVKTGGAITKGAAIASDANGKAVAAASGKFILGYALASAAAADEVILVQITKSGYQA